MQIVGVVVAGGPGVFVRPLVHGTDPHRLAWELGYRIVRPLSATGMGDDLTLTVQVSAHGRPVTERGSQRRRALDPDLTEEEIGTPLARQRLAAYSIVLSDRGLLATEFSERTAVPGSWGLPGGGIDAGENPSQAVIREAVEETGFEVGEVKKVFELYMSPGGVTEIVHFFIAEYSDAQRTHRGGGVEDEDIDVLELPFARALEMVRSGEIRDGKAVILLQYLQTTGLMNTPFERI